MDKAEKVVEKSSCITKNLIISTLHLFRVCTSRKMLWVKYLVIMVRNEKCIQHFGRETLVTRMHTEKRYWNESYVNTIWKCGLEWACSRLDPVASFWQHGNYSCGSLKARNILTTLWTTVLQGRRCNVDLVISCHSLFPSSSRTISLYTITAVGYWKIKYSVLS
jgi:hypothetical protein